jgi:hypothetical protein
MIEAVTLALTSEAIWACYLDEVLQVPLGAIAHVETRRDTITLYHGPEETREANRISFRFQGLMECRAWSQKINQLKSQGQPAQLGSGVTPRLLTTTLIRRVPRVRFQMLGVVVATGKRRCDAEAALKIRGAMLEADAVIDVHEDDLPELGRGTRHLSGTPIRVVDQEGRAIVRTRALSNQLRSNLICLNLLILPQAVFVNTATRMMVNLEPTPAAFNLIAINWPVVALCLLLFVRSPLLLKPLSITLITYAILCSVDRLVRIASGLYLQSSIISIPFTAYQGLLLFETLSYRSYYQEYQSLAWELERENTTFQKVLGALAAAGAFVYVVVMVGFLVYFSAGLSIILSSSLLVGILRGLVFPPVSLNEEVSHASNA